MKKGKLNITMNNKGKFLFKLFSIVLLVIAIIVLSVFLVDRAFIRARDIVLPPCSEYISENPDIILQNNDKSQVIGVYNKENEEILFRLSWRGNRAYLSYYDISHGIEDFGVAEIALKEDENTLIIDNITCDPDSRIDFGTKKIVFVKKNSY